MKTKKSPLLTASMALVASLAFSQSSSASIIVLAGWYEFENLENNPDLPNRAFPDVNEDGFETSTARSGFSSTFSTGGDMTTGMDSTYGNSDIVTGSDGLDGYLRGTEGNNVVLNFLNNGTQSWPLRNLYFDAARCCELTVLEIIPTYYPAAGGQQPLDRMFINDLVQTSLPTEPVVTDAVYDGRSYNLSGLRFGPGDRLNFQMVSTLGSSELRSNLFLDNVALTAVPEPGNFVAVGLLIGSGLMLRVRPRRKTV